MKRGRDNPREVTTAKATKKKAKGAVAKAKEVAETAVEERNEIHNEGFPVAEETAELDDEWASLWSSVDEEMSWANCWCPFWEMENIGDAYDALYEDVLWDFDIWDFKSSGDNAPIA